MLSYLSGDACGQEFILTDLSRVCHGVDGEHDARLGHSLLVVHVPVEQGRGRGLPLVQVQDVGVAVGVLEELERGPAEVEVRLDLVVAAAVDAVALEDV